MTSFYRFRPISRLLGDSRELESQTIYFASPAELNDPMEGHVNVVFRGDKIVWENLLRHFAGCLASALFQYAILGENAKLTVHKLRVKDPFESPVGDVATQVSSLADRLVASHPIQAMVRHFSSRTFSVSEAELRLYLKQLHEPWAVDILRLLPRPAYAAPLPEMPAPDASALIRATGDILSSGQPDAASALEAMFRDAETDIRKRNIRAWVSATGPVQPDRRFVHIDFVDHYLRALRLLIYPDWYTACFMDDITDASVWGHYANGHRDVCLRFRATTVGERHSLPLRAPVGAGSAGIIRDVISVPFKKVSYSPEAVELNFFTAMGNLPVPTLNRVWRVSRKGKLSQVEREVHGDEDRWRAGYWQGFESSITTKLQHWAPEREHRLIFHSDINDLSDVSMRLMRYNFNDLEAIVFGVNTSGDDKESLVSAIRDKCLQTGRTGFEFLQAERKTDGSGIGLVSLGQIAVPRNG